MPGLGYSNDISLGTQIPSFQGLMLSTFTFGIETWEGDLKSLQYEDSYDVSCRSVFFKTHDHILLAESGNFFIELHALKLTVGSQ